MDKIQDRFNQIEEKLLKTLENNLLLRKEVAQLKENLQSTEIEKRNLISSLHHLEEDNKKIKVASAVSGNEEYKNIMKLQLNKLIKEIDLCLVQLKSN